MNTAAVHCSHSEIWPLEKFVEHPRNPNFHPSEQIGLLAKIILAHGWRSPIVVSKRSGFIIKGHGRLDAARRAGMKDAPVELQDYASEAEELADMVADNRLPELAEMDEEELKQLLAEVRTGGLSTDDAGFGEGEYRKLLGNIEEETTKSDRASNRKLGSPVLQYNLVFDDEAQQQQWFALLKALRTKYPQIPTIAGRLCACISETGKAPAS